MTPTIDIRPDDLSSEATRALIAFHLAGMHETSPPESVHALDVDALRDPAVSFWSAWAVREQGEDAAESDPEHGAELAGIAALKVIDADRGEVKSMRVDDRFLGLGVGRALLRHLVADARQRGLTSLWLETGSTPEFAPAQRLYASEGFVPCGPFEGYREDPFSVFMTRAL